MNVVGSAEVSGLLVEVYCNGSVRISLIFARLYIDPGISEFNLCRLYARA